MKAIILKNSKFIVLTILVLFALNSFPLGHRSAAFLPSPAVSQSQAINVTLTSTQILRVITPASSNVTLLSVKGDQYDTGLYASSGKNVLLFTPLQNANYSLKLNISSFNQNYAAFTIQGSPTDSWSKNLTGTGNLIVTVAISVVAPPSAMQSSSWNPLFGFTGISLGGITLDATDVLVIFALFSVALIAAGMKYSQKLVYGGLFFLGLIGMVEVGILVVGLVLGLYVAGFAVVKSLFGIRARRRNL